MSRRGQGKAAVQGGPTKLERRDRGQLLENSGAMKQEAENLIRQLKESLDGVLETLSAPDLHEKRSKLRAVNRSIEQLERKELPVPVDLCNMRDELTRELGGDNEAEETLSLMFREFSHMLTRIENYNSTAGMRPHRRKRRSKHGRRDAPEKGPGGFLRRLF